MNEWVSERVGEQGTRQGKQGIPDTVTALSVELGRGSPATYSNTTTHTSFVMHHNIG